jgi:hypothetical protein
LPAVDRRRRRAAYARRRWWCRACWKNPSAIFSIGIYEEDGGVESGFMYDRRRQDHRPSSTIPSKAAAIWCWAIPRRVSMIRARVASKRLLPAIERFFQFRPTRMDRYMVSCYDAETGGHFFRHRDNLNAGCAAPALRGVDQSQCKDYDGCDLMFPEFGRRLYRAPHGGAIVFSTGALHQVTPITRGKRYAFVPFSMARKRREKSALPTTRCCRPARGFIPARTTGCFPVTRPTGLPRILSLRLFDERRQSRPHFRRYAQTSCRPMCRRAAR